MENQPIISLELYKHMQELQNFARDHYEESGDISQFRSACIVIKEAYELADQVTQAQQEAKFQAEEAAYHRSESDKWYKKYLQEVGGVHNE